MGSLMKRLLFIICSFLVLFSGVAAAWEDCKRMSFSSGAHHLSSVPVHPHEHHADADQQHSHGTIVHCPTFSDFLLTAAVSVGGDQRVERLPTTLVADFDSQFPQPSSYSLIHGPPGFAHSFNIPRYLSLSVLRI